MLEKLHFSAGRLAIAATAFLLLTAFKDEPQKWYGVTIHPDGTIEVPEMPAAGKETTAPVPVPPDADTHKSGETTLTPNPVKQRMPEDESIPIGFGSECVVQSASIVFGGQADASLSFPAKLTSPTPGAANSQQTGKIDGLVPGQVPATRIIGNAFEYHSELNNIHGCTSRQLKTGIKADMLARKSTVFRAQIDPWQPDADTSYQGTTQTGQRQVLGGTIYEGTSAKIHWLDAPGVETQVVAANRNFIHAKLLLLRSITYDGNGTSGRMCITGHSIVWYPFDGTLLPPALAQARLQAARNAGGAGGPQHLTNAARVLSSPVAQGGHRGQDNPEFRNLGCYSF